MSRFAVLAGTEEVEGEDHEVILNSSRNLQGATDARGMGVAVEEGRISQRKLENVKGILTKSGKQNVIGERKKNWAKGKENVGPTKEVEGDKDYALGLVDKGDNALGKNKTTLTSKVRSQRVHNVVRGGLEQLEPLHLNVQA